MRKIYVTVLFLLVGYCGQGKSISVIDTVIAKRHFSVVITSAHDMYIRWGQSNRNFHVPDSLFEIDFPDCYESNRIYIVQNGKVKKNKNRHLYIFNDENVLLSLPGINSFTCIIGLRFEKNGIRFYNTHNCENKYYLITSPSILVSKKFQDEYAITYGSKSQYFDVNDSVAKNCSTVNVLSTVSSGNFYLYAQFPLFLPLNGKIDVYDNDLAYYQYIIGLKHIENPLDYFYLK